jgi:regulator of replication initiation timing
MAKVAILSSPDEKKLQRIIKNRISAENHRKRKKEELGKMLETIKALEEKVATLEKENILLRNENNYLKKDLQFNSIPSPTISNQSLQDIIQEDLNHPFQNYSTDTTAGFRLEDFVDFSGLEQTSLFSIFTIFMFGFASLLPPNYYSEPVPQKLICAPSVLPTIDYFQDNLKDWHQDFALNSVNSISLSTEKNSMLSFIASKQPSSAKSLFTTGLNVDTALFPSCSKSILPTLIFQPFIRIVPLLSANDQDGFERLKFSLFAHASGLGIDGINGILRLDLQVFKATWMDHDESHTFL